MELLCHPGDLTALKFCTSMVYFMQPLWASPGFAKYDPLQEGRRGLQISLKSLNGLVSYQDAIGHEPVSVISFYLP